MKWNIPNKKFKFANSYNTIENAISDRTGIGHQRLIKTQNDFNQILWFKNLWSTKLLSEPFRITEMAISCDENDYIHNNNKHYTHHIILISLQSLLKRKRGDNHIATTTMGKQIQGLRIQGNQSQSWRYKFPIINTRQSHNINNNLIRMIRK